MKKIFVFYILLLSTGLVATDDKNDNELVMYNGSSISNIRSMISKSRSLTPCCSPESSDNESDEDSSSDESFDDTDEPFIHTFKSVPQDVWAKPFLERFGGYLFGGAFAVLIMYKFYSAGYL